MKRNNQGFSYVELILVMAIMAIMTTLVTISMGLVTRADVNRGAEKLQSAMEQARSTSMAKGSERGMMKIWQENGSYYYYIGPPGSYDDNDKVELVSSSVNIGYTTVSAPGTVIPLGEGSHIYIRYNQATGCFMTAPEIGNGYYNSIVLSNGNNVATIRLYSATGKCEID